MVGRMVFILLVMFVGEFLYAGDYGGISIFPYRLVFSERVRTGKLFVKNYSDKFAAVKMVWKYKIMNEEGRFSDGPDSKNLVKHMIVFVPRILYLDPGEGQIVRFILRMPSDIKPGEYHSHLVFVKETEVRIKASSKDKNGKKSLVAPIIVKYGLAIPIVVRFGNLSSKISLPSSS